MCKWQKKGVRVDFIFLLGMSDSSAKPTVLDLSPQAYKLLLDEERLLKKSIEMEKAQLEIEISNLVDHIRLADQLAKASRINQKLYDKVSTVLPTFTDFKYESPLLPEEIKPMFVVDLSDKEENVKKEIDQLETKLLSLKNEKLQLENKESANQKDKDRYFHAATAIRQQCDTLIKQIESEDAKMAHLETELDKWTDRSKRILYTMSEAVTDLEALKNAKDFELLNLIHDIASIYSEIGPRKTTFILPNKK